MFTGIVEELGNIQSIERHGDAARVRVACRTVLSDAIWAAYRRSVELGKPK